MAEGPENSAANETIESVGPDVPFQWEAWAKDHWLWLALALGLFIRILPMILWPQFECIRDECIYRAMADEIRNGHGLTVSNKGWLPSPGYPYMLAWSKRFFGSYFSIKFIQIGLSLITTYFVYGLGHRIGGTRDAERVQVARVAAFLFALHPTLAWFTNTQWIETIYIFFVLGSMLLLLAARAGKPHVAALSGVFLGCAVLFKGVATYMPPLFLLAAVYPWHDPWSVKAWLQATLGRATHIAAFIVGLVLVVAPYSVYGSKRHGGFMVVDATVGHVLFLGNNDFPPLTFDYGNGMLTQPLFGKYLRAGRRPCARDVPPVKSSKCEVDATVAWAKANPGRFIERIPARLAQLFNPNSFLTRHVRWGYWTGFPWWAKELLSVLVIVSSIALTWGGAVAAWARARGPYAWMALGSVLYTIATTVVAYGMTRFRLPIEALMIPYLAIFIAQPRATLQALKDSPSRLTGAMLTLPPLVALTLWYLPTGFPMFW
jgi:4-amino-4-deoxy-L-arabinose transferase-like glycosyltransferase